MNMNQNNIYIYFNYLSDTLTFMNEKIIYERGNHYEQENN